MIIIVLTMSYPFDRPLNIKMMLVGRLRLLIYNKDINSGILIFQKVFNLIIRVQICKTVPLQVLSIQCKNHE